MSTHAYLHYSALAAEAAAIEHYRVPVREWAERTAYLFNLEDFKLAGVERAEFVARLVDLANEYLPGIGPEAAA